MLFDRDGTLVYALRLKALSYARAAAELCRHTRSESDEAEAFRKAVGLLLVTWSATAHDGTTE
jgi:hypothetical protein